MVFGDKNSFAIEVEVNERYDDYFIGDGFIVVYIKNICYGRKEKLATSFPCSVKQLETFIKNNINNGIDLNKYTKDDIAFSYYIQNYSDLDLSMYNKDFLFKTKCLTTWDFDEAFDDGSYIIHFDYGDKTRIIGFKSCIIKDKCMVQKDSVNEVYIQREEFVRILGEVLNYLRM